MSETPTPLTDYLVAQHFERIAQAVSDNLPQGDIAAEIYGEMMAHAGLLETRNRELVRAAGDAPLTFAEFRAANVARCVKWHPAGIESWSPSDWLTAVTGELGELASLLKIRNRERDGLAGNKFSPTDKQIADEIADVLTYLDLLAAVSKFNEVSARVGFPDRIARKEG